MYAGIQIGEINYVVYAGIQIDFITTTILWNQKENGDVLLQVANAMLDSQSLINNPKMFDMQRIQRKRGRGWRMPENTIYVGRPGKWGNPFPVNESNSLDASLSAYKAFLEWMLERDPHYLDELKGKDLACWCNLSQRCHADILLSILNSR